MVNKYRDVIRMTLFGRHDKNLNDTTSIYQGYDRYQQTTTGGGVTGLTFSKYYPTAPNIYILGGTGQNALIFTATMCNQNE